MNWFIVVLLALSVVARDPAGANRMPGQDLPAVQFADENVCGTAQLEFFWGDMESREMGLLYFFANSTFYDYTYDYWGPWWYMNTGGYNVFYFEYPTVSYVSPTNNGVGSMIQQGTNICGSWSSEGWKWLCPGTCA